VRQGLRGTYDIHNRKGEKGGNIAPRKWVEKGSKSRKQIVNGGKEKRLRNHGGDLRGDRDISATFQRVKGKNQKK